uniref:Uncharacterized protein MANES_13G119200 n=1 Tax=Rhizophora mucronata TaxID=61149 RepID=A0A2P2NFM7_RHIMU
MAVTNTEHHYSQWNLPGPLSQVKHTRRPGETRNDRPSLY